MSIDQKKSEQKKIIVFFLTLTGMLVSLVLLSHRYGGELFCGTGGGCDTVGKSEYSMLFGIPLALVGYIYFSFLFVLTADSFFKATHKTKNLDETQTPIFKNVGLLFLFSSWGVLADLFLFFTMIFVIESFCWLCFFTYLINIFIVIFTYAEIRVSQNEKSEKPENIFIATIQKNIRYLVTYKTRAITLTILVVVFALSGIFANNFWAGSSGIELNAQDTKELEAKWQDFLNSYKEAPAIQLPSTGLYNNEKGNKTAPLVIVEFSDFLCPYCKVAAGYLKEINEAFPQDVFIIHQNFPLDKTCNFSMQRQLHEGSCLLSKAAICAGKQDAFWKMYFLIFANQDRWSLGVHNDDIMQMVTLLNENENININTKDFKRCLDENKSLRVMQNEIQRAVDLNINATPTLFFNGKKVSSFPNFYILKRLINYEKEQKEKK